MRLPFCSICLCSMMFISAASVAQVSFGPEIGINYSGCVGGYNDVNYHPQYGYSAGGFLNFKMKANQFLQSELIFNSMEFNFQPASLEPDNFPRTSSLTLGYVETPLTYQYLFENGLHLNGGTFIAYQISQHATVDTIYYDPPNSQWPFPHTESESHEITANRFQAGLTASIGYLKSAFDLSLNSQYNLTSLFSINEANYRKQHLFSLSLTLGYHIK